MRRFIVCAASLWIAQCATQAELDRRTFIAKAIRRSPTHNDIDSEMPMARGLRPKTKKPTPAPTLTTPVPTPAPTRSPVSQKPVIRRAPPARPNYPPPTAPPQAYQQQQGYGYQNYQQTPYPHPPPPQYYQQQQQQSYPQQGYQQQQGYQYPSNYPYYTQQSRPQQTPPPQQQQHQPFYNPFMPYGYQSGQPMMVPVPVPVPMPSLPGFPNLMQPFEAPTTAKPRKTHHKRRHYATLMPQEELEQTRSSRRSSPTQEEIDAMDVNEVRRAPSRKNQQHYYEDDDYSEEEASTAATLFPTMPTMLPAMKLPTLPPFTLPPSFEKLLGGLGITTPKPKKEKRRKEKRRREYEDEEEYEPVKRRRNEEESRPHGRSLAVEEDRGRRDPFEGTETGFEEQKEEKESAPSISDRLTRKSLSSNKKGGEKEGEEDWLVPFRK